MRRLDLIRFRIGANEEITKDINSALSSDENISGRLQAVVLQGDTNMCILCKVAMSVPL